VLIFKGGTCLRKCYFPNYRFSEDLDFTSTDATFELTEEGKKVSKQFGLIQMDDPDVPNN
jgi:predicted nucleotidyltransferase component of viral defense system